MTVLEQDQLPARSGPPSIWPPLLLSLWIAATFAEFRRRDVGELWGGGGFDAQVLFQIGSWLAFGVIGVWLLASGRADLRLLRRGPLFWYCGFIAVAVISTVYSAAPMLSLYRSIQLAVAVVLVISLRERLRHLYMLIVAYVAVNWVLFLIGLLGLDGGLGWLRGPDDLYVDYDGNAYEAWRLWTAFGHPSHISIVAGVAAIGLAARATGRQWLSHGPLVAWLLLTVMLTVSRSAMVAVVIGLGLVTATRRGFLPMVALGCGALFVVLLAPDAHQAVLDFLMRGQSAEDFASLTGRKQIYDAAIAHLDEAWVLGHGFRAARVFVLGDHGMVHAHNLILEVWLGLGVLGVLMAGGVVLALIRVMLTLALARTIETSMHDRWELVGIAIPVLAFCVLDSGFALEVNPFVMVFIAALAKIEVGQRWLALARAPVESRGHGIASGTSAPSATS